jgi:uncharacterized protein (DUF302 family)
MAERAKEQGTVSSSAAQTILNTYPRVSVFLPCRISLYEQEGS